MSLPHQQSWWLKQTHKQLQLMKKMPKKYIRRIKDVFMLRNFKKLKIISVYSGKLWGPTPLLHVNV